MAALFTNDKLVDDVNFNIKLNSSKPDVKAINQFFTWLVCFIYFIYGTSSLSAPAPSSVEAVAAAAAAAAWSASLLWKLLGLNIFKYKSNTFLFFLFKLLA